MTKECDQSSAESSVPLNAPLHFAAAAAEARSQLAVCFLSRRARRQQLDETGDKRG